MLNFIFPLFWLLCPITTTVYGVRKSKTVFLILRIQGEKGGFIVAIFVSLGRFFFFLIIQVIPYISLSFKTFILLDDHCIMHPALPNRIQTNDNSFNALYSNVFKTLVPVTNIIFVYRLLRFWPYFFCNDIPRNTVPQVQCKCHSWTLVSMLCSR